MMGHNVWHHINSVQEANRRYDSGCIPKMLVDEHTGTTITDIIDAVFSTPLYEERIAILDYYEKFFMGIAGARGMGGKKAINASAQFVDMFEFDVGKAELAEEARLQIKPPKTVTHIADEAKNLFEGL